MAKTKTLLELRTRARQLADMVNSTFVSDAELNNYINDSIDEYWDLVTAANQDYFTTSTSFTISSGNTYSLPATFYKLRGLDDLANSSYPKTVRPYNWAERNDYRALSLFQPSNLYSKVMYRIVGSTLYLEPTSAANGSYKLWWIPSATTLSADGDTIDGISGWHDLVTIDVAIKMLIKEESSTTVLERRKADIVNRIREMGKGRDMGSPPKVSRVRTKTSSSWWPLSRGA